MGQKLKSPTVGVVVIGRNEGERLLRCLQSVIADHRVVIYVDSGSQDDSVAAAQKLGAIVVELDLEIPFTAARARNVGWRHLRKEFPDLSMLQFLDGDCELVEGWLEAAQSALEAHSELAVVCGRRRERYPEASFYNFLCDMEWDTPVGDAESCGGDALMRTQALQEVEGFDDGSIAGEEPELCFRLRQRGWGIERLPVEMTLHDAAITTLRQWWQRSKRAGHAYAGNYRRHSAQRFRFGELRSAFFWGFGFPLSIVLACLLIHPGFFFAVLLYPIQIVRVAFHLHRNTVGYSWKKNILYATHCVASKFPHVAGMLDEWRSHRRGWVKIIEYK